MAELCKNLGLDINEVMKAQPWWMIPLDYAEEELITFYEN